MPSEGAVTPKTLGSFSGEMDLPCPTKHTPRTGDLPKRARVIQACQVEEWTNLPERDHLVPPPMWEAPHIFADTSHSSLGLFSVIGDGRRKIQISASFHH